MKLDARTVQILKNFSAINPSLQFTQGKTLVTVSPGTTTVAKAVISEELPSSFAIHNLSRFLGVLSLFESPNLDIGDNQVVISSGNQKVNYTYADPRMIITPNPKLLQWIETGVPNPELSFTLTADTLHKVLEALKIMQLPDIAVTGENGSLYIEAIDSKNPTADSYRVLLGQTDYTFRMIFKSDNIKLMHGDYKVGICSTGLATFAGTDVNYWITCEDKSVFNK